MYSPTINPEHIPKLYQIAKSQKRPMTKLVNDIIDKYIKQRCKNCLSELDLDEKTDIAYCEHCESIVFTEAV